VLRALETKPEMRFATAMDFRTQVEIATISAKPSSIPSAMPQSVAAAKPGIPATHRGSLVIAILLFLLGIGIPFAGIAEHNSAIRAATQNSLHRVQLLQSRTMELSSKIAEANAVAGRAASRAGNSEEREETRAQAREERQEFESRAAKLQSEMDETYRALKSIDHQPVDEKSWRVTGLVGLGLALMLAGVILMAIRGFPRAAIITGITVAALAMGAFFFAARTGARSLSRAFSSGESIPTRSKAPKAAFMNKNGKAVLVHHDDVDAHYVLFAPRGGAATVSDSRNTQSLLWLENGGVRIAEGRTFSYLRKSLSPHEVNVNGEDFELHRGRVFVLHGDGRCEQVLLFPMLQEAMDPQVVMKLVEAARELTTLPVTVEKLQGQLRVTEDQLEQLLQTYTPESDRVQEVRRKVEELKKRIEEEKPDSVEAAPTRPDAGR
jgi:hypothetical protein